MLRECIFPIRVAAEDGNRTAKRQVIYLINVTCAFSRFFGLGREIRGKAIVNGRDFSDVKFGCLLRWCSNSMGKELSAPGIALIMVIYLSPRAINGITTAVTTDGAREGTCKTASVSASTAEAAARSQKQEMIH